MTENIETKPIAATIEAPVQTTGAPEVLDKPDVEKRKAELARLEKDVQKGLNGIEKHWMATARALAEIKASDLHLTAGYRNFGSYCIQRWGASSKTVEQRLKALRTAEIGKRHGITTPAICSQLTAIADECGGDETKTVAAFQKVAEATAAAEKLQKENGTAGSVMTAKEVRRLIRNRVKGDAAPAVADGPSALESQNAACQRLYTLFDTKQGTAKAKEAAIAFFQKWEPANIQIAPAAAPEQPKSAESTAA